MYEPTKTFFQLLAPFHIAYKLLYFSIELTMTTIHLYPTSAINPIILETGNNEYKQHTVIISKDNENK